MPPKILCAECFQPLTVTIYPGHAAYIDPCDCAEEREREVAQAAASYTREEIETHFAVLVEEVHDQVELENDDEPGALINLNRLLSKIVRGDAEPDFNDDPYDDLDI